MTLKDITNKYKHCCYQFDNWIISDEKNDLSCTSFEDVDGRIIFESYNSNLDSYFFNYCPFCGYKGQVKNENFEMD